MDPSELTKQLEDITFQNRTAYVYDEFMLTHSAPFDHVENPKRISHIFDHWTEKGLTDKMTRLEIIPLTADDVSKTHSLKYLDDIKEKVKVNIDEIFDGDSYLSVEVIEAAYMSASGCNTLIDAILTDKVDNGFAVIRPPGHHCNGKQPLGFCFINNVVVAANKAIEQKKASKVAIVDWDVHHGDGSEVMTYDREDILFISLHRHDYGKFYPSTGKHTNIGEGAGEGYNLNIPFNNLTNGQSFIGDDEYMLAFQNIVLPVVNEFRPDLIIISCGFDSCVNDQLGMQSVSQDTYGWMTERLMEIQPKVAIILEGGYCYENLRNASEHCVRSLMGINDNERLYKKQERGLFTCPRMAKELSTYAELFAKYWKKVRNDFPSKSGNFGYLEVDEKLRSEAFSCFLFETEEDYNIFVKGKYMAISLSGNPEESADVLKRHSGLRAESWCLSHVEVTGENFDDEFSYINDGIWIERNIQRFVTRASKDKITKLFDELVVKVSKSKEFFVDCQVLVLNDGGKLTIKLNPITEKTTKSLDASMVKGLMSFNRYLEDNTN